MGGMGMGGMANSGISSLNKPVLLWLGATTQSLPGEITQFIFLAFFLFSPKQSKNIRNVSPWTLPSTTTKKKSFKG